MHRVPVAHQGDGQQRQGDDEQARALKSINVMPVLAVPGVRLVNGGGHG